MFDNAAPTKDIAELERRLEAANLEIEKLHALGKSWASNNIGHFEWDFTTGVVQDEVYVTSSEGIIGMADSAGMTLPCRIDDLSATIAEKFIDSNYAYWYKTNLTCSFAQSHYDKYGNCELAMERKLKEGAPGCPYARYSILLYVDPESGHLMGRGIIKDVTNRYNILAPIEFKETDSARGAFVVALKQVFLAAYHVNLEKDTLDELVATELIHGMVSTQRMPSANMSIAEVANLVDDSDRQRYLDFMSLDTLDARMEGHPAISMEFLTKDGRRVLGGIIPVSWADDGTISKVVVTARNNTEYRKSVLELHAALAESEALQALNRELSDQSDIVANAGLGMWHIILKDGCAPRMQANWKMFEILGIPGRTDLSEEEVYSWWWDRITPGAIPSVNASVGEMLDGKFSENTYLWEHPDKGLIYTRCGGTCVTLADGTHVVSGYHGDVTDIVNEQQKQQIALAKARDAANAANDAKTAFLFNMSHDIRTPMNAIIGYTNLLKKYPDDAEKRASYLDKIASSSDFLLELINNVLEMARIDSGKTALDEAVCSVGDINKSLFSVFEGEMAKKGITYTKSVSVEHEYLLCDTLKIREIFLNILSNALKYTPAGGEVHMEVKELPCDLEGHALIQTKISDNGIGMSSDYLPHIFEQFSREKTSTENKVQGTGLGMPIVKKLIDLMGGTIEVESEPGHGTTFTVTIQHRISEAAAADKAKADADAHVDLSGKRILLAEDNDLNAEIATEILKETGAVIERAEDGIICVNMLEKAQPGYYDVILMDIQMPNMDGHKATRIIRRIPDPEKASIPIIAMTANAFEEDRRLALEAGMNGHLSKPIDIPELMRTLAETVNK